MNIPARSLLFLLLTVVLVLSAGCRRDGAHIDMKFGYCKDKLEKSLHLDKDTSTRFRWNLQAESGEIKLRIYSASETIVEVNGTKESGTKDITLQPGDYTMTVDIDARNGRVKISAARI